MQLSILSQLVYAASLFCWEKELVGRNKMFKQMSLQISNLINSISFAVQDFSFKSKALNLFLYSIFPSKKAIFDGSFCFAKFAKNF